DSGTLVVRAEAGLGDHRVRAGEEERAARVPEALGALALRRVAGDLDELALLSFADVEQVRRRAEPREGRIRLLLAVRIARIRLPEMLDAVSRDVDIRSRPQPLVEAERRQGRESTVLRLIEDDDRLVVRVEAGQPLCASRAEVRVEVVGTHEERRS